MNKRRLLKLADLLVADARKKRGIRFNMSVVVVADELPEDGIVKLDCGTQACAMGLAAISGAFKRCGLSYRVGAASFIENGWNIRTTVNGRARHYDSAAMAIFDLTQKQAHFLFDPTYYSGEPMQKAEGERHVAKRIRDFVAGKVSA